MTPRPHLPHWFLYHALATVALAASLGLFVAMDALESMILRYYTLGASTALLVAATSLFAVTRYLATQAAHRRGAGAPAAASGDRPADEPTGLAEHPEPPVPSSEQDAAVRAPQSVVA